MSIKDRIRELTERVDRMEMAMLYPLREVKCQRLEVNINNDPEIIGNVMRCKGKDYLEAKYVPNFRSYIPEYVNDRFWIPLKKADDTDNILITDELACTRTKKQPIWVMVSAVIIGDGVAADSPCKLFAVETNADPIQFICNSMLRNTIVSYKCRLANIDDLKEAGIR